MILVATKQIAFGNGTRPKGFEFGQLKSDSKWFDVSMEARLKDPAEMQTANCTLAEGVTPHEFKQAILNVGGSTKLTGAEPESVEPVDWQNLLIADSKLSKAIKGKLADAGLSTLGDVESYTTEHEGFGELGLTESQQDTVIKFFQNQIN